jgi:hypothetical protein
MTRTRSLMAAVLLAGVALSFLPLSAGAQVPSYPARAFQRPTFAAAKSSPASSDSTAAFARAGLVLGHLARPPKPGIA